jgi:DNA-binding Lrp family transcriptional regulator
MKLDERDRKILSMLRENSRTPNVDIARDVGITEGAVRSRIKRLTGRGVIVRFTVDVSEGAACYAVVMVKSRGQTKEMMARLAALSLHKDAYEISGEYDGCVIIYGDSVEDLDLKVDRIRNLPEVADTRTYVSFKRW